MSGGDIDLMLGDVVVSPASLRLSYTLANRGDRPAYAVNRLFHRGPEGFRVDPDLVYADVAHGLLNLRKHMVEVPDEIDVEAPEVPYVTPLPAGETFEELLEIPVPVELRNPYLPPEAGPAERLRLLVGVVVAPERAPRPAGDELRLGYRDVVRGQRVLSSQTVALSRSIETVSA